MRSWRAVIVVAIAASGCASGPYAVINGHVGAAAPFNISGVIITEVDGRAYFDGKQKLDIKPGSHAVEVMTTRRVTRDSAAAKQSVPASTQIHITAKPCMEYHVIARHDSGAEDSPWRAEIARVEPIAGCNAEGTK